MVDKSAPKDAPITIKKYANRRLYNTATSSYVTLDHLATMVKEGTDFVVFDAKSGDDITRTVLTQIIVEEESKGQHLLPVSFLRHLISFYGDSLQSLVPRYLDHSMQSFAHNQDGMRRYMADTMDGIFPFNKIEEMGRQNVAILENTMKMFSPFYGEDTPSGDQNTPPPRPSEGRKADGAKEDVGAERQIEELRGKMDKMQRQLDALTGGKTRE